MKNQKSVVSYSELVKQLSALQAANAVLQAAVLVAGSSERTPLKGTFTSTTEGDYLTLTFVCNSPAKVSSKPKSAKQETQALYSQPRGGVGSIFDPASRKALHLRYGKDDVRVICSLGIR